jgi:hypothetical protein
VSAVDWNALASALIRAKSGMAHNMPDVDFYAELLRRTFEYRTADEQRDRERALPYEHLKVGLGLTTQAEADYTRDSHTFVDRHNRERAEQQVKEMRAEVSRVYREAAKDLAEMIRQRCNDRTVPSRYRREGVAWAADLIDPSVPKDQFGNVLSSATEAVPL